MRRTTDDINRPVGDVVVETCHAFRISREDVEPGWIRLLWQRDRMRASEGVDGTGGMIRRPTDGEDRRLAGTPDNFGRVRSGRRARSRCGATGASTSRHQREK